MTAFKTGMVARPNFREPNASFLNGPRCIWMKRLKGTVSFPPRPPKLYPDPHRIRSSNVRQSHCHLQRRKPELLQPVLMTRRLSSSPLILLVPGALSNLAFHHPLSLPSSQKAEHLTPSKVLFTQAAIFFHRQSQ